MSYTTISQDVYDVLYGDKRQYGYLFPFRSEIPSIKDNVFLDLKQSDKKADEFIVSKMMDIDYIGWTAKTVLNLELFPLQIEILRTLWDHAFPMLVASRGGSKSFTLAVYAVLRALLDPGVSIVIIGAGLRQARLVFNYIENLWHSSPVLRDIVGGGLKGGPRQNVDLCYFKIGESIIYALPLGDGSKIRGFRANIVIADEFASIKEEVFDVVVQGFAATTKSPVDEAKRIAFEKSINELDIPDEIKHRLITGKVGGNQIIHSGTAYFAFNHFAKRFQRWKDIISSKGDVNKVAEIFGGPHLIPKHFNYKDYAIIRIPYNHLPEGMLDQRQLSHAKANLPESLYLMEYGAIFVSDSDGFYKRSLIESCTLQPDSPIETLDGSVLFHPMMRGIKGRTYAIGIDPAAERDNFAITILEIWPNHYRIVYCWSVNKPEFEKRKKTGLVTEEDYYAYCCSKIRQVVSLFNPIRIEMDSQGGGYAIAEMLRNEKLLDKEKGDFPIYEIIEYDNPKPTDSKEGRHILHLVQQGNTYNADANVFLHNSFETKSLLFPAVDVVQLQAALNAEKAMKITFDTFEDCVNDIEQLKHELCTIQMSQTATNKEKFDTPNVVTSSSIEGRKKRGKLKKDRYTSLLLVHKYAYENRVEPKVDVDYTDIPGNIRIVSDVNPSEGMYCGPGIGHMRNAKDWIEGKHDFGAIKNKNRI